MERGLTVLKIVIAALSVYTLKVIAAVVCGNFELKNLKFYLIF